MSILHIITFAINLLRIASIYQWSQNNVINYIRGEGVNPKYISWRKLIFDINNLLLNMQNIHMFCQEYVPNCFDVKETINSVNSTIAHQYIIKVIFCHVLEGNVNVKITLSRGRGSGTYVIHYVILQILIY